MKKIQNENWVNALPDEAVGIAEEINIEIAKVIAERIKTIGELSPGDIKKLSNSLQFLGADFSKITKLIAKYCDKGQMAVVDALQKAADGNDEFASVFYSARGIANIKWQTDTYLNSLVESITKQTSSDFINLSQTLAYKINDKTITLRQMYTRAIDKAIYEVQSGTVDYHTAMRKTVKQLSGDMRILKWQSGYTRRLDSHVRQNLIDGIKQLQVEMLNYHGERFGSDGVEISAHAISAPDHLPVQGRQFSNEEFDKMQIGLDFEDVKGNQYKGFARPITQWNCRHIPFRIIIGVSEPAYTEEQLKEFEKNSRQKYDLTQQQRAMETKLRKLKTERLVASAAGDELEAKRIQRKINEQQNIYRRFSEKHNLLYDTQRASVEGYRRISAIDKPQKDAIIKVRSDNMIKELENQRYGRNKDTIVNKSYIDSGEYKRKFDTLDESECVKKTLYDKSKEMLKHRSGTTIEDMYWIDSESGQIVAQEIDSQKEQIIDYSLSTRKTVDKYRNNKLVAIHSHPSSMPPSISDFNSCYQNRYKMGYISCHNGSVFAYTANEEISEQLYNLYIASFLKQGLLEYDAQIKTLEKLMANYDINFWEVK